MLRLLTLASLAVVTVASHAATRPNVVILLADDQGWADVGYHSDRIKTPNLDALAKHGVELDRFYVYPICSPTRAALMTGRYPIRFGLARAVIPPWRNYGLDTSEVTIADVLAKAEYSHRAVFGKWHLGHHDRKWHPLQRGFTHFRGHYNGAIDYFELSREGERDWHEDYAPSKETGYATDLIADAACRFIRAQANSGPFFCYVPFNAPHSPFQVPDKYKAMYPHLRGNAKTLAGMITCMDDGVGRILKAIDDAGITDNTIVWYFSDNGGIGAIKGNNLPLRGNKQSLLEGGIRVPAAVRWPAGGWAGGRKVTAPLSVIDVLPTLMTIVGVNDHGGRPLDGLDVGDVISGKKKDLKRELLFYWGQGGELKEQLAVIDKQWKLRIVGPNLAANPLGAKHTVQLFSILEDPYEKTDRSSEHPQVVERLSKRLIAFRKLQSAQSVPAYGSGRTSFQAPKDWKIP